MDPPQAACPMRDAMSEGRQAGGFVASRYPKPEPPRGTTIREHRRCRCGAVFAVFVTPGRPPRHCLVHRYGTRFRGLERVSPADG